jgi:hypothetical protein
MSTPDPTRRDLTSENLSSTHLRVKPTTPVKNQNFQSTITATSHFADTNATPATDKLSQANPQTSTKHPET